MNFSQKVLFILLAGCLPTLLLSAQSTAPTLQQLDDSSWALIDSDSKRSIEVGQRGLHLAQKQGQARYQAVFLRNIGVAHYMADSYDSAHYYLNIALEKANALPDDYLVSRIYTARANVYLQTSQYTTAIKTYLEALHLSEKLNLRKEAGKIHHNIGVAYQRMDNMTQALQEFEKSRAIAIEVDDTHSKAYLNMAISNIYMDSLPQKALALAQEALILFKENENHFSEVMAILTIAQCHYFNKQYDQALIYANQAKELAANANFPKLTIEALLVLSNIYYYQRNYAASEAYAERAIAMDTTTSHLYSNLLLNVLRSSIRLNQQEKAVAFVEKYREHVNRFANDQYQESLSEMQVKYEAEKKELTISALETEKKQHLLIALLIGSCLIGLLVFLVNRNQLIKQKAKLATEQLKQAEQEQQLVVAQASLEGETAERSRLARDLHDGLGSMLSVVKFSIPSFQNGAVIEHNDLLQFNRAIQLLDQSIQELRRIAHHLMPESLIRLGLKDSLTDFCNTNPKIHFQYFGNAARIDNKLEILLYRAVHELVNNALKHANAQQINVQLVQEEARISVVVQDDGQGFDSSKKTSGKMGLLNIQHRVQSFNGTMDIYTDKNGTEIHLEFPLPTNQYL